MDPGCWPPSPIPPATSSGSPSTTITRHASPAAAINDVLAMSADVAPVISVMLIVPDAEAAVAWYRDALGATEVWNLGGVAGLEIDGAPFFLHEVNPDNPAEGSPGQTGITTHGSRSSWMTQTASSNAPSPPGPPGRKSGITRGRGERTAKAASTTPSAITGRSATDPRCAHPAAEHGAAP